LTNNILGTVQSVEKLLETEELAETDEVPDLPRLPPTFLAHHAKGTRATFSRLQQKWRDFHNLVIAAQPVASRTVKSAGDLFSFRT